MSKKIAVVALLCTVIAVAACRREEPCCQPLKLGGPAEMLVTPQMFEVTHLVGFFYSVTWNTSRKNLFNWKD